MRLFLLFILLSKGQNHELPHRHIPNRHHHQLGISDWQISQNRNAVLYQLFAGLHRGGGYSGCWDCQFDWSPAMTPSFIDAVKATGCYNQADRETLLDQWATAYIELEKYGREHNALESFHYNMLVDMARETMVADYVANGANEGMATHALNKVGV
jgi:hypothetical protein